MGPYINLGLSDSFEMSCNSKHWLNPQRTTLVLDEDNHRVRLLPQ